MKKQLVIALLFISFFGCKTKHKIVDREKETVAIAQMDKSKQQISENLKTDSIANLRSSSFKTFEGIDIDIIQADSSKTITIITPDGKKTTIKGANVKLSKQKETTKTNDTTSVHLKKEADKSTVSESQSNKITNSETVNRSTNTQIETKGILPWWLLLVIIPLGFAVYKLRKFIF